METFAFSSANLALKDIQLKRYQDITHSFRCVVCENESLADSNARMALYLKDKIANMIQEGKSNAEIKNYFFDRYGAYIFYDPPINKLTLLIWLFPYILLTISLGLLILFAYIKRYKYIESCNRKSIK